MPAVAIETFQAAASQAIARCRQLAARTETPGMTTRTFLSEPMRDVHRLVGGWMLAAGMQVSIDNAGNIRGVYAGTSPNARRLYIGSHLDTVPNAGAFDGILGVVLGVGLVEALGHQPLRYSIEVIGFSEEEGVRFGVPFIGSRAVAGSADDELLSRCDQVGVDVRTAIRSFGLDPSAIGEARVTGDALGYFELHIEQGPVLESLNIPVGVVEAIVGQSRWDVTFTGQTNHAGTTPMHLRKDAVNAAAEWIVAVEREALATPGLVATTGHIEVDPGARNVIPGRALVSLDVRHVDDRVRQAAVDRMLSSAREIVSRRGLSLQVDPRLDQAAVAMDDKLISVLAASVDAAGLPAHRMPSGAGHDAMIMAKCMPVSMLFLRSPGGISHQPEESVVVGRCRRRAGRRGRISKARGGMLWLKAR
ncbi:MAG: allantoate amidohydrolase [Acidobacteriota bacterium]